MKDAIRSVERVLPFDSASLRSGRQRGLDEELNLGSDREGFWRESLVSQRRHRVDARRTRGGI